jgi:hypothetical protein
VVVHAPTAATVRMRTAAVAVLHPPGRLHLDMIMII